MKSVRVTVLAAMVVVLAGLCSGIGYAQEASKPAAPAAGGAAGGDRTARMAEFRQRMNDRIKEELGASTEEWAVLQPRIEKVQTLQMESRVGGMGMMGRGNWGGSRGGQGGATTPGGQGDANAGGRRGGGTPGGTTGGAPPAPTTEVGKAAEDLRKALEEKSTPSATIKAKLDALHAAREKSRQNLAKAQGELREVLNVRQEAQLTVSGLLD